MTHKMYSYDICLSCVCAISTKVFSQLVLTHLFTGVSSIVACITFSLLSSQVNNRSPKQSLDNVKLIMEKKRKRCVYLSFFPKCFHKILFTLRCLIYRRSGSRIRVRARTTIFPRTNPYGSVYREIYRSFQRTVDARRGGRRVPPAGFYRGHRAV